MPDFPGEHCRMNTVVCPVCGLDVVYLDDQEAPPDKPVGLLVFPLHLNPATGNTCLSYYAYWLTTLFEVQPHGVREMETGQKFYPEKLTLMREHFEKWPSSSRDRFKLHVVQPSDERFVTVVRTQLRVLPL